MLDQGVERADLAERLHVTRKRVDHALRTVRRLRDAEAGGQPAPLRKRRVAYQPAGPQVDWRWQDDAACKGKPLHWFFDPEGRELEAEKKVRVARAEKVCRGCPVRTECLDYAISQPERAGTWGGLDEDERAHERRRRMKAASNQRLRERAQEDAA